MTLASSSGRCASASSASCSTASPRPVLRASGRSGRPAAFERDALERERVPSAPACCWVASSSRSMRWWSGCLCDGAEISSDALERVVRRRASHPLGAGWACGRSALASALERLARECDRAVPAPDALAGRPRADAAARAGYAATRLRSGDRRVRRGRLVVRAAGRLERELPRGTAPRLRLRLRRRLARAAPPARPRCRGAPGDRRRFPTSPAARCSRLSAQLSNGSLPARSASRRSGPRPTVPPPARSRWRAGRSPSAATPLHRPTAACS